MNGDEFLVETSTQINTSTEPFNKKEMVYVLDQNNGNYNGQIIIDTSSLSNSGKYISLSEAYLIIPLIVTLTADTAAAHAAFDGNEYPFLVGLKNGFHQLIHSISVEYNNTSVVQLTPHSNFYTSFKLVTQLSQDDVHKLGPSIGFHPDTANTFDYTANIGANVRRGPGVVNNRNFPDMNFVEDFVNTHAAYNKGLYNRQLNTAFQLTVPDNRFIDRNACAEIGKNFNESLAASHAKAWYVLAKIRLKDMHDFFDKMPLTRGGYIRMIINTNTATHTLRSTTAGGGGNTNIYTTANIITGGTSPLLLSSLEDDHGGSALAADIAGLAAGNYDFTLRIAIGRDTTLNLSHPTLGPQTRLYVPTYVMNLTAEENYLTLMPTKRVVYEDIYSYTTNVGAGETFNVLLSNGIPRIKTVVVIPFLAPSANPVGTGGTLPLAPYQSPFASEPATTSPLIPIRNFNVQISGVNMFLSNEDYDYSAFCDELYGHGAINGGLVNGLSSGLISELDFQTMYRYYVCDVSRRVPEEDRLPKSITITGTNKSLLAIQLHTFVVFEREITIKPEDGSMVRN